MKSRHFNNTYFLIVLLLLFSPLSLFAATTDADFTLDDGTGDSPQIILRDATGNTFILQKMDAGEANLVNNEGAINLKPSNDLDDFIYFLTSSNLIGFYWDGVLAYTNDPGLRINSSGQLEYRDQNEDTWTTVDSLGGSATNLSDLLDTTFTGLSQGDVAYYNGTAWVNLEPGTSGYFLQTRGAGANPRWSAGGSGSITAVGDITIGAAFTATAGADGNTLYFEGSTVDAFEIALTGADAGSDVTVTIPAVTDTLVGKATTDTLTNKTLTSAVLDTGVSGTAVLDEDTMTSDSATKLATQQSIKAYVDAQVSSGNFADNTFTVFDNTDNTKVLALETSGITTGTTRTLSVPDYDGTIATVAGSETLTNKTLTSPIIGTSPTAAGATWTDLGAVTTTDINGGTIDAATVGATTPAAGTFTNLQSGADGADGQVTIFSEQGATDYSVILQPNAAMTQDTTYTFPADDGAASDVLTTDGAGALSWAAGGGGSGIYGADGTIGTGRAVAITDTVNFDSNTFFIDGTNNKVGIGDTAPEGLLTVQSADSGVTPAATADELFVEGSGDSGITIGSGIVSKGSLNFADSGGELRGGLRYDHATDSLAMLAGGLATLFIKGDRVGINTASPLAMLTVQTVASGVILSGDADELLVENSGDAGITIGSGSASQGSLYFSDSEDSWRGGMFYTHADDTLTMFAGGAPIMSLENGKVGIGDTAPESLLTVQSADSGVTPSSNADELFVEGSGASGITIGSGIASSGAIYFDDSGGTLRGGIIYSHSADAMHLYTAGAITMSLRDSNVGIGDSTPTRAKLVVEGNVSTDNGAYGYLTSGGSTGTDPGGTGVLTSIYASDRIVGSEFDATSDRRVKNNIHPYKQALKTISSLNVVGYNKLTKSGSAMGELGLIGQELIKVFPVAVRVSPGDVPNETGEWEEVDDFHAVNYQSVFMLSIKAIQEQQSQIEELKIQNNAQKKTIAALEQRMSKLESR